MTRSRGESLPQRDARANESPAPSASASESRALRWTARWGVIGAAIAAAVLAIAWSVPISMEQSSGWDESMHVALPAARVVLAMHAGELREGASAVLDCAQYPFAYPLVLAAVESVTGISERVMRATGTVLWCATLFGLFLLVRELVRSIRERTSDALPGGDWAPWLAMTFAALSPLALAYAGTGFLEVPFACTAVFTLRSWVHRMRAPTVARELATGAWITVCIFTKFNYGLLLAAALALEWLFESVAAARTGEMKRFLLRSVWLLAIPALALAWWFLAPWPGGPDVAALHRQAVEDFLLGNRSAARTASSLRVLHAATYLHATPRLFVLTLAGLVLAARWTVRSPAVRCIAIVLASLAIPAWIHPFHLDRFWIPVGIPWWSLAALGWAGFIGRDSGRVVATVGALALSLVPLGARDTVLAARALGELSGDPRIRAYQEDVYAGWDDLSGSRRLPTAGLERGAFEALFEAIASEVGSGERIAWLGMSSEVSPAAFHLELLRRGGSPQRFRRDAHRPMDVAYFEADPGLGDAELERFLQSYDVFLFTDPIDLKDRAPRRWVRAYVDRLVDRNACVARAIASIELARPLGTPRTVTLFACRKT